MRLSYRCLVASVTVASLAACGDAPTNPTRTSQLAPSSAPAFDFSGGGSRSFGDQSSDFTVTARGGSFSVNGLFTVNFPENSVCSPARSTYGPTEWDKSCSTLDTKESVKVTARVRLTPNGVAVDFSPGLRFAPSTQVTVSSDIFANVLTSNRAYFAGNHDALNFLAIGYSQTLGAGSVADYLADPSLITHVNLSTGVLWRRVKHFSGYAVVAGDACTPSPDHPECVWVQ